jgi:hypothetical protein
MVAAACVWAMAQSNAVYAASVWQARWQVSSTSNPTPFFRALSYACNGTVFVLNHLELFKLLKHFLTFIDYDF